MEELTSILGNSLDVSEIPNNPAAPHPRFTDYKIRNKKADQDERRRNLLKEQKRRRDVIFNEGRGLVDTAGSSKAKENDESLSEMECSTTAQAKKKHPYNNLYTHTLMLSEWLVEVPEDLAEEWLIVPCPQGRRTTVVAYQGNTTAWSRRGKRVSSFPSALPGGCKGRSGGYTVLDCIWCITRRKYFVLDVLHWNTISVLGCETEFRFIWLQSKFSEIPYISVQSTDNRYSFSQLPFSPCSNVAMSTVMSEYPVFIDNDPQLDGLLFYHKRTHYTAGITPLVGWLKPHMMPEILSVPVAEQYLQQKSSSSESAAMELETEQGDCV